MSEQERMLRKYVVTETLFGESLKKAKEEAHRLSDIENVFYGVWVTKRNPYEFAVLPYAKGDCGKPGFVTIASPNDPACLVISGEGRVGNEGLLRSDETTNRI